MLEVLIYANFSVARKHHQVVRITIPDQVQIETVFASARPGWDAEDLTAAQAFGDEWFRQARTAILRVPTVVTERREYNIVINPAHSQAALIEASIPELMRSDLRLFGRG